MSKGSIRRARQVEDEIFDDNWERIFGPAPEDHYVCVYSNATGPNRLVRRFGPYTIAKAREKELEQVTLLDPAQYFTMLEKVDEQTS